MKLSITRAKQLKPKPDETQLGFGTKFTDHMFNMDYAPDKGWHNPRIEPYGMISMDPATMVLHYGQGVSRGSKPTARLPAASSSSGLWTTSGA